MEKRLCPNCQKPMEYNSISEGYECRRCFRGGIGKTPPFRRSMRISYNKRIRPFGINKEE